MTDPRADTITEARETYRKALGEIKDGMSREAFVAWGDGMMLALESMQARVDGLLADAAEQRERANDARNGLRLAGGLLELEGNVQGAINLIVDVLGSDRSSLTTLVAAEDRIAALETRVQSRLAEATARRDEARMSADRRSEDKALWADAQVHAYRDLLAIPALASSAPAEPGGTFSQEFDREWRHRHLTFALRPPALATAKDTT